MELHKEDDLNHKNVSYLARKKLDFEGFETGGKCIIELKDKTNNYDLS